ncbi:MAG: class I SAM-dependent methyltransferase [Candidatus Lokiarchaeota archaeon]
MKPEKYNGIAQDYHNKRKNPWKDLEHFLDSLKEFNSLINGINLDLGCANGRNFKLFKNKINKLVGLDNSTKFMEISKNRVREFNKLTRRNIDLIVADMRFIPFRNNSFSNIFSIAAIHHIKSKEVRDKIISNIKSILKPEGLFLLTLWRRWQKRFRKYFLIEFIKEKFNKKYNRAQKELGLYEFGDIYIPWTLSNNNLIIKRFYHLFSKNETQNLLKDFEIKKLKKSL